MKNEEKSSFKLLTQIISRSSLTYRKWTVVPFQREYRRIRIESAEFSPQAQDVSSQTRRIGKDVCVQYRSNRTAKKASLVAWKYIKIQIFSDSSLAGPKKVNISYAKITWQVVRRPFQ